MQLRFVHLGLATLLLATACSERQQSADAEESGSEVSSGSESETSTQDDSGTQESGTEGETTTETGEDEGDQIFVPDGDPPPVNDCDLGHDDCPEGEKCVWYALEDGGSRRAQSKCIPVTGEGAPFDPCTLPNGTGPDIRDDCGADSYCLEVYGTADHGFCAPYANPDASDLCADYPGSYFATENGSSFPNACLHYECQPFMSESCPEDMRCTFYPAYLYGSMMCWRVLEEQDLPLGAPCDFGQCGEGKLCAPADWLTSCEGDRCCASWCDLDEPSCANEGTSCELFPVWNYHQDPGFESLGACLLPGTFEQP